MRVAVNLSPVQFRSRDLVATVAQALARAGLAPDRLELEITETVLLQDTDATLATLRQLQALGVRIAMDDFGTGYSSLSYLRRFPFDRIKIDQSFVHDMCSKQDCGAIVRAVAGLGNELGMATTAEGVETAEQLDAHHAGRLHRGSGLSVQPGGARRCGARCCCEGLPKCCRRTVRARCLNAVSARCLRCCLSARRRSLTGGWPRPLAEPCSIGHDGVPYFATSSTTLGSIRAEDHLPWHHLPRTAMDMTEDATTQIARLREQVEALMKDRVTPAVADAAGRAEVRHVHCGRRGTRSGRRGIRQGPRTTAAGGADRRGCRLRAGPCDPLIDADPPPRAHRGGGGGVAPAPAGAAHRDPGRFRHCRDGVPRGRRGVRACLRVVLAAAILGEPAYRR